MKTAKRSLFVKHGDKPLKYTGAALDRRGVTALFGGGEPAAGGMRSDHEVGGKLGREHRHIDAGGEDGIEETRRIAHENRALTRELSPEIAVIAGDAKWHDRLGAAQQLAQLDRPGDGAREQIPFEAATREDLSSSSDGRDQPDGRCALWSRGMSQNQPSSSLTATVWPAARPPARAAPRK